MIVSTQKNTYAPHGLDVELIPPKVEMPANRIGWFGSFVMEVATGKEKVKKFDIHRIRKI